MSSSPGPYPPAPGSGPSGQSGAGPWTPAPDPAQQPTSRKGLYIGLGLGCLGLVIVAVVVIALIAFFALRGGSDAGGGSAGSETTQAASPQEQATALVTEYMDALVAGDSATALELRPADGGTQLSTEAYDAALAAGPIADVTISDPIMDSDYGATITVEYTVGGTAATEEFSVSDYDGDGVFELDQSYATVLVPDSLSGLGLTVAGEEVADGDSLHLLPGAYELAVGAEHFTLASTDPFTVTSDYENSDWPDPALTEDGLEVFRGAVQDAVDECIAMTTLESGCGLDPISAEEDANGIIAEEGTVERSLTDDAQRAIDTMTATPSYDDPTYVKGEVVGTVDTTMQCTQDGVSGTCSLWWGNSISVPSVDMADPELPVSWS